MNTLEQQIKTPAANLEQMARELAAKCGYSLDRARELIAREYSLLSNALVRK